MTSPSQNSARIPYLDGLRGLGALLVVVGHMWLLAGAPQIIIPLEVGSFHGLNLLFPLTVGDVRVSLFLVLSGFFLYLPFVSAAQNKHPMTLVEFARRRARRILPAYYAALGLSVGLPVIVYYASAGLKLLRGLPVAPLTWEPLSSVVTHLFILQGLSPEWFSSINGPHWTLTLEVQLYIVFPILVWFAQKRGMRELVVLAVVSTLIYRVWIHRHLGSLLTDPVDEYSSNYYSICRQLFIGRLGEFVLGMLAVDLIYRKEVPKFLWTGPLLFLFSVVSFFVASQYGMFYGIADMIWGITFFLLVLCCYGSLLLNKLFSNKILSWIGRISYSIYLIHFPLLYIYLRAMRHTGIFTGATAFFLMLTAGPFLLLASHGFYTLFEKPFLNSRKRTISSASY